jgi:SOS-response transcriptional repressor LexA
MAVHGYAPSTLELKDLLHVSSTNGVLEHLKKLERKGLLKRDVATARSIRLTDLGLLEMLKEEPKDTEQTR